MQQETFDGQLNLSHELGWHDIESLIQNPCKVLILTHKNPDGDAVGSALGLQWVLKRIGHTVDIIVPDDSPLYLKWLPGHQQIAVHERKSGKNIPQLFIDCDLIFCVDFNTPERLGAVEPLFSKSSKPVILIDHHPKSGDFAHIKLIDPSKGSTSELVFLLIEKLGLSEYVGPESATCLLAGILTDTVEFKVNCSYPEIFETVASLMRLGADKDRINNEVYNMHSADRMRLLGYCLNTNMKILPGYKTAYIALTKSELNSYNHRKGDTEGFVNYPLSINGVVFSVLFTEQDDHIKLSLRSRGNFPANEFARKYFNGGGHKNAAGGRYFGSFKEALDRFEIVLDEYKELLLSEK